MKSLLIFLVILMILGCKRPTSKIVDKYENGQAKTEYVYTDKNDTSTYTCNVYYESGKLKHKTEIISGMFVDNKITYYENGKLQRIGRLSHPTAVDNNRYDCHITNYRPEGTIENDHIYENDKINGLATEYDSTGTISRSVEFNEGKMNGKEIFYFPGGKIKSIAFVKNDTFTGFNIDFKENGDTLKWFYNEELGANGIFL